MPSILPKSKKGTREERRVRHFVDLDQQPSTSRRVHPFGVAQELAFNCQMKNEENRQNVHSTIIHHNNNNRNNISDRYPRGLTPSPPPTQPSTSLRIHNPKSVAEPQRLPPTTAAATIVREANVTRPRRQRQQQQKNSHQCPPSTSTAAAAAEIDISQQDTPPASPTLSSFQTETADEENYLFEEHYSSSGQQQPAETPVLMTVVAAAAAANAAETAITGTANNNRPQRPQTAPQNAQFNCRYCHKQYVKPTFLQRHEREKHGVDNLHVMANANANANPDANPHANADLNNSTPNVYFTPLRPFACSLKMSPDQEPCHNVFFKPELYLSHLEVDHGVSFTSMPPVCTRSFWGCPGCGKIFPNKTGYLGHCKRVHGVFITVGQLQQGRVFTCDICGKVCANRSGLTHHRIRMHPGEPQQQQPEWQLWQPN
mgnify:CR=1 FL=1